jgi:hypothetical protein
VRDGTPTRQWRGLGRLPSSPPRNLWVRWGATWHSQWAAHTLLSAASAAEGRILVRPTAQP